MRRFSDLAMALVCGLVLAVAIAIGGCEDREEVGYEAPEPVAVGERDEPGAFEERAAGEAAEAAAESAMERAEQLSMQAQAGGIDAGPTGTTVGMTQPGPTGYGAAGTTVETTPQPGVAHAPRAGETAERSGEAEPELGERVRALAGTGAEEEPLTTGTETAEVAGCDDPRQAVAEMDRRLGELKDKIAALESAEEPPPTGHEAGMAEGETGQAGDTGMTRVSSAEIERLDRRAEQVKQELDALRSSIERLERDFRDVAARIR